MASSLPTASQSATPKPAPPDQAASPRFSHSSSGSSARSSAATAGRGSAIAASPATPPTSTCSASPSTCAGWMSSPAEAARLAGAPPAGRRRAHSPRRNTRNRHNQRPGAPSYRTSPFRRGLSERGRYHGPRSRTRRTDRPVVVVAGRLPARHAHPLAAVNNDASGAPTLVDLGASSGITTGGVLTLTIAAAPNAGSVSGAFSLPRDHAPEAQRRQPDVDGRH